MVDPGNWSATPGSNPTVDGINIAENCPTGNLNGGLRAVMAGVRTLYDTVVALTTTVSGKLSASGAIFSGTQPTYVSEGALLHHASSSNTSGKVSVLADGSADPSSPSNGDMVFFYTP